MLQAHLDILHKGHDAGHAQLAPGEPFEVGRNGAACQIPDALMSRRHFVLEQAGDGLFIEDLQSVNGTFLNEKRIGQRVAVGDGDKIRAGETIFLVRLSERQPQQIADTGWHVVDVPRGWTVIPHLGLQRPGTDSFIETIICKQDAAPAGAPLADYVGKQVGILRQIVKVLGIERLDPVEAGLAEEDEMLRLAYRYEDRDICQYQYYARRGEEVGILTWTKPPPAEAGDIGRFGDLLAQLSFEPGSVSPR